MRPRLQFGPFTFDPELGELSREGQRIALQEKPRQLLLALLERPGEVATREALRQKLWQTDTFVDFEHGLNTAIKKVRKALGDPADAPQFIETLSRRGYRFIAPVRMEQAGDIPAVWPATESQPPARRDTSGATVGVARCTARRGCCRRMDRAGPAERRAPANRWTGDSARGPAATGAG